ncbi:MAG: hypothetical protein GKS05_09005 [Nitrospirales bacterium]|nr:hypothetical protein [Nitrospirales bacterium]
MKPEVTNARRMAQTAWIALFLYTFFGFHQLGNPIELLVGGIKLEIPKLLVDCVVPIFSIYATGVFYYSGFWKNESPRKKRKYLREFKDQKLPVELMRNRGIIDAVEFRAYVAELFPEHDPYAFTITDQRGNLRGDHDKIQTIYMYSLEWHQEFSTKTNFLCFIDNHLYAYPLYLNTLALAFYPFWVVVCPG